MNAKRRAKLKQLAKRIDEVKKEFEILFKEEDAARRTLRQPLKGSAADKLEDCVLDLMDLSDSLKVAQETL